MAHADYDCCAIYDVKMTYGGWEATTKEQICDVCLEKLREMGIDIKNVEDLIEFIEKTDVNKLVPILVKLEARRCYYWNEVDELLIKKGIKFDENRYVVNYMEAVDD